MSDFTIDIELSLSKAEREAMAVLERLERQFKRLNQSVSVKTNLDLTGVDQQVKVLQQKITSGKVEIGLPTDQQIAQTMAKVNAASKTSPTSPTAAQSFPKSLDLGASTLLALKDFILKSSQTQKEAVATSSRTIVDGLKKGLVSTVVGNAGGIVAASAAQNAISNGGAGKAAKAVGDSINPELTKRASEALKELVGNDPLLNKVKNSFDNLVVSIRAVDGVEESIQGLSKAFKQVQPSIDEALVKIQSFTQSVIKDARVQALYIESLKRIKSTTETLKTAYEGLVIQVKELDERFNISAKALDLMDSSMSAVSGGLRDLRAQFEKIDSVVLTFEKSFQFLSSQLSGSGVVSEFLVSRLRSLQDVFEELKKTGDFTASFSAGLQLLRDDASALTPVLQKVADQSDRWVTQLKDVRKASKELRESLGEVSEKYSALSGIIGAISTPLKAFEIELGGITKYLKRFTEGMDSAVFALQEFERLSDLAESKLKKQSAQSSSLSLVVDDSIKNLPALLDRIQSGLQLSGSVKIDYDKLTAFQELLKLAEASFDTLVKARTIQINSNLSEVEAGFRSSNTLMEAFVLLLKEVKGPTPIKFGFDDVIGAADVIGKLKASILGLSSKATIEIAYGQLVEAEVISERLTKSLVGVQQKMIGSSTANVSIDDSSLEKLDAKLLGLNGRKIEFAVSLLDDSLKASSVRLDELKDGYKTIDIEPVIDIEKPVKKAESIFAKFKKSIEKVATAITIDSDVLISAKQKFEEFKDGVATVQSVMIMETPWVEVVNKHVFDLKDDIKDIAGVVKIDDSALASALKTSKQLTEIKQIKLDSSDFELLSKRAIEASTSIKTQISDLKALTESISTLKKQGENLSLAPSLDKKAVSGSLSSFEGKTIEIKAVPVFEEVYAAYKTLDENIVNGKFRVEAIPEFDNAFTQLKALDSAIDGIKKESKLTLSADGLDGSVKAFQAVEEAVKGVVSAMDNAARLSNQSLSTLKSAVEATPAGGDLRTKAPFVAQSLIEQEKLAEQSLKRLKALAADLKIEPLGNKNTKAAYITAIEEFITAGGKIGDAWKRTEAQFEDTAKKMRKTADSTGKSMVDDMNHSAADTVAAAWRRTEGVFEDVTKTMVAIAEKTGAELVAKFKAAFSQIESLSKNIDIKIDASALEKIEKVDHKKLALTASDTAYLASSMIALATATDNAGRTGAVLSMIGTLAGKVDSSDLKLLRAQIKALSEESGVDRVVKSFAHLKDSAETVSDAWKRTNMAFHSVTESMEEQAKESGKVLVDNLNHRAADTVAAAWERTRKSVGKVYAELSDKARTAGKDISENLTTSLSRSFDGFKESAGEAATIIKGRLSIAIQQITTEFKSLGATLKGKLSAGFEELSQKAEQAGKEVRKVGGLAQQQAAKRGINFDVNADEVNQRIGSVRSTLSSVASGFSLQNIKDQINSIGSSIESVTKVSNVIGYLKDTAAQKIEAMPWLGPLASKAGDLAIKFGVGKIAVVAFTAVIGAMVGAVAVAVAGLGALVAAAVAVNAAWRGMTDQIIGSGAAVFEGWRNVSEKIIQAAVATVDAWKSASSAIVSTGQSIISTWQSVTSTVIAGGQKLYDTWKSTTDVVTGFAASSVKAYAEVETSIKAVSGILDLSTKQSEELFASVQKTGQEASNKFSTKQISALAATLAKGGKQVDEIRSLLSPIATGATAIGEEDLSKFGGNFLDVISKFGIPLEDSQKAVELYVKTLTSAKLDASNFANTIKYANVEKEGIEGLKDLSAQTIAFAQVGTRGSKVGTDVNRVMTELAIALEGTSKKAERQRDILKELGLAEEFAGDKAKDVVSRLPQLAKAFNDLEKETGRDNAIAKFNELLGSKGTQAILSFSKVSAEKFQEVRKDLESVASGATGVVKKFASLATSGVSGAIVALQNNLETVQAQMGKSISKIVAGFATIGTSILSTIGGPESPVFKSLTAVGEKVEKLFSAGGKGEELASKLGKAFEGLATKGLGVFSNTIENVVSYFSDTKNINELTKRIEYLGYVFVEVYKIMTQLIGGFAAIVFQIVGAVQAFSQSSSGQALGAGMNTAFTAIATGGASLLDEKLQSIQAYFGDQTNIDNFTNALQFVGKAALIAYSSLTDMLATMYKMSVAAIGIVDQFSKTDVGQGFFKSLNDGFRDLSEQAIALTTKRLQEFSDYLQKGTNAQEFAAQLKSIGELSLFAYDGLTQAVAGLANVGLQAAKTTNDFLKSQEGIALIDRLSTTFKKVGDEANNLIQKGLGQLFEYISQPYVSQAIENIALGFLKLYDGLTRIVGIGFDGLLKLGSTLGQFFSSPKGQSLIDKLVSGFQMLMDVGIGFLLEQLDAFTNWANQPGNIEEMVNLLKSAAELWLTNYIALTKFNLEMAAFVVNIGKGLAAIGQMAQFKSIPLLDTAGTMKAIDEVTGKLAGFRLYQQEQARMDKEKGEQSSKFFSGATEAFMASIAPAVINIKAAIDDFLKNGAPSLGQIVATLGTSLGIIVQILGNAIALVIRIVTASLPIINLVVQPILGFINLIASALANVTSASISMTGAALGAVSTLINSTLTPISQFVGGMFNGGIKNMGILATVIAQGFASIEALIRPVIEFIVNSFYKLPENASKIFGAVKDIVQANWGAISQGATNAANQVGDGFKNAGNAIGGAFDSGKTAAVNFGDSVKSGAIAKLEEVKQFTSDLGLGMQVSWSEALSGIRQNYDDYALNFGVTSQQIDQFFIDTANKMREGWELFTGFITTKWGEFAGFFTQKGSEISAFWTSVTTALGDVWNAATGFMSAKWNEFTSFVSAAWAATMTALQPYLDALSNAFNAAVAFMTGKWNELVNFLVAQWQAVSSAIVAGFQAAMNAVGAIAQNTGNALIGFFTQAANAIGSVFAQIGQGITAFFQPAVDAVNNIVQKLSEARSFGDAVGKVVSGQVFQGARADGGPVKGGAGTYLVGERGPELFTPKTDGYIIPNHALAGFRADGGPVSAGKTYVVGEIGTEAFVPGSGKKTSSFSIDFTSVFAPLLAQATRAGDHLNTIALAIKNIQNNAYAIAFQAKPVVAELKNVVAAIAKIPAGGGGFQMPNLDGFGGFNMPTINQNTAAQSSIKAAFKAQDKAGIEAGLIAAAKKEGITDKAQLAYLLATAKHESDNFATLTEYASGSAYEGRSDLGNTQSGDGVRYKGRGFVQLTGRANYAKYSKILGLDLIKNPELAADPEIAARILAHGMKTGAYTGAKLSDYGSGGSFNAVGARAIVNGSDQAGKIAGYSGQYLGKIGSIEQKAAALGDGGTVYQSPSSFGQATGSTKVAGTLPKLSVSSLGVGSAQEYGAARPGRRHAGQDIDVFYTDPAEGKMYSMLGGIVIKNWEDPKQYFNYTDIYNPGQNLIERIAERGTSLVKEGQEVKPGQVVTKGVAPAASAIHYEIRKVQKDSASKFGVSAVSPYLGAEEGSYNPIKKLEELGLGTRSGSTFTGSGQVLASNGGGGGQSSGGFGGFTMPNVGIMSYEQFAGGKGDGGTLTQLPSSLTSSASASAAPTPVVNLPELTVPKTVSGKGGTKQVQAKIDPQKLKVALKAADIKKLTEIYDKSKGQTTITAKLLPKTIRDIYGLSGTEELQRNQVGALLINLNRLMGVSEAVGFNAKQASLGITSGEFKKAADLATEASAKGVEIPVEMLGSDFKKAVGKTTGSIKATELLKILSELKTADPEKYASVSSEAIDRVAFIASLSDGERKNLDELVARLERDKRERVVASELPDAVRKLLGVKNGDESVAVDRIKTLIKEIGELPISLPADLETALASLSERELKNAIETIKDAQRAGDKAIFASSLTPELRKGLGLKASQKIDIAKLAELLPTLEGRLSKIAGSKELGRLEQVLKFNKIKLPSSIIDKLEKDFTKVIEEQKFDLASLSKDELNALEKLGVLRSGALGVGESYIDEAKLKKLYGDGATIADAVNGTVTAAGNANKTIADSQKAVSEAVTRSTPFVTSPGAYDPFDAIDKLIDELSTWADGKILSDAEYNRVIDEFARLRLGDAETIDIAQNAITRLSKIGKNDKVSGAEINRLMDDATKINLNLDRLMKDARGFDPYVVIDDLIDEFSVWQSGKKLQNKDIDRLMDTFAKLRVGDAATIDAAQEGINLLSTIDSNTALSTPTIERLMDIATKVNTNLAKSQGIKSSQFTTVAASKSALTAPPTSILDSLDFADLSVKPEVQKVVKAQISKPSKSSIQDRIREIAAKTGSDAFAIQAELQRQGLKAIGAVGGTGILPTINEINATLKSSASFTQAETGKGTSIQDRIREIVERTGLDAFKIQDELQKMGLKAIGAVGGKGVLPTITEIRKILDVGLQKSLSQKPINQAVVSAGLPVANAIKPIALKGKPQARTEHSIKSLLDSLDAADLSVKPDLKKPVKAENPILAAAKKVGTDAFAIQKELEKQGLKAVGAVGGKGVLPTINEINAALKSSANGTAISSAASGVSGGSITQSLPDRIREIAKKTGADAFAIQKELEKGGLKAIGAVGGKGQLPTIAEIQSALKNSARPATTSTTVPGAPPLVTDAIGKALGVDGAVFKDVNLKDPFAIQKALEKAGFKSIGALGTDGKIVKASAANELPTIDRIRKAVDGAMGANDGLLKQVGAATTATLDTVQAQTESMEAQIAKLYGVDATGLTGLSGFALATEIQKRVQAKGGRAVGGLNSTKANELPTISEINSKLVDLSKTMEEKKQAATGSPVASAGGGTTATPTVGKTGGKKFEFSFGGDASIASREEVEGKLKQFEQYLNSDEFLAVAVEMVLNALKNDSRARLFTGLL